MPIKRVSAKVVTRATMRQCARPRTMAMVGSSTADGSLILAAACTKRHVSGNGVRGFSSSRKDNSNKEKKTKRRGFLADWDRQRDRLIKRSKEEDEGENSNGKKVLSDKGEEERKETEEEEWEDEETEEEREDEETEEEEDLPLIMWDDLSVGDDHWGVVTGLHDHGAFVRLMNADQSLPDGFVPMSELSIDFVASSAHAVSVGQTVRVRIHQLSANRDLQRYRLSIKRARPVLPDLFEPCTVVLMRLDESVEADDVYKACANYGQVLEHWLIPLYDGYDKETTVAFCTYESREEAQDAIDNMKQIDTVAGKYQSRVRVKMAYEQTYKAKLQAQLNEQYEMMKDSFDMTPEVRRSRRMAERSLDDLLPRGWRDCQPGWRS